MRTTPTATTSSRRPPSSSRWARPSDPLPNKERTAMRRIQEAALVITAAAFGACDAPSGPSTLEVTLTANPDPATASAASGVFYTIKGDDTHPDQTLPYAWRTTFTVNVQETGGKAVD